MSTPQHHVPNARSDNGSAGHAADEDPAGCYAAYMVREQTGVERPL